MSTAAWKSRVVAEERKSWNRMGRNPVCWQGRRKFLQVVFRALSGVPTCVPKTRL